MSAAQAVRNLPLAARTVIEHLGDDPMTLLLQASRKLPAAVVVPAAKVAGRLPHSPTAAALSAHVLGDGGQLRRSLDRNAHLGGRARVRLADVALAANQPDTADRLLEGVDRQTPGLRAVRARRRWHAGDMDGAVKILRAGNRRERRTGARLAAEARVFGGWRPAVAPQPAYRPADDVVLHLLTNSLPYTGSGYAQRSHSLLRAQADAGWTVHAATRVGYPVQLGNLAAGRRQALDGVTYHRLLPSRLPFGMDARLQLQAEMLLELALQTRPAVLHTTTHFVNALVVRAVADALGIPWVYEVRGQLADTWASTRAPEARLSQRYVQFQAREAEAAAAADLVPTLGTAMADGLTAAGADPDRIVLLPNAVGEDFLSEPVPPGPARAAVGLAGPGPIIGTVSSVVDYEGLDDLLRATALLLPRYPELRCMIVGDGAALPGLRALAAELGIAGQVIFTGRVPREAAALHHQALDIFVVPRRDLPVTRAVTPLKPVEALAAARPVVASSLPALAELVRDGETGILTPPSDPPQLAEALARLLDDGQLRARMGAAGRAEVIATRTWAANARLCTQLYQKMRRGGHGH